jgi:transcriptional regulator with XRE-family HTH domain
MSTMVSIEPVDSTLAALGARLRHARIASGQPQALFAQRIGVSVPTLRAMERGAPSTAIGNWLLALWALDALDGADHWLPQRESLLEQLKRQSAPQRQRAPRRTAPRRTAPR